MMMKKKLQVDLMISEIDNRVIKFGELQSSFAVHGFFVS